MFSIQITVRTPLAARAAHIQEDIQIRRLVPIKWLKSSIMTMVGNTTWRFSLSKFLILPRASTLTSTQTSRIRNSLMKKIGLAVCYKRARISHLAKISRKIKPSTRLGHHLKMPPTQTATKIWYSTRTTSSRARTCTTAKTRLKWSNSKIK